MRDEESESPLFNVVTEVATIEFIVMRDEESESPLFNVVIY